MCFALALIPIRQKAPKYFFFSLTEEQAIRNRRTDNLLDFLNEPRFGFDAELKNSLIEVRSFKLILSGRKISVTFDMALYLLFRCIKRKRLLRIYNETIKKTYNKSIGHFTILEWKRDVFDFCIWQDFFDDSPTKSYLFTTQSSETKLPTAFIFPNTTSIKKIMFWYGTNTEPIGSTLSVEKRHSNVDQLNYYVNRHYVWDLFQSEILRKKGILNTEVKGSILFTARELRNIPSLTPSLIYFDVTPYAKSVSFYTEELCMSTLNGVISACEEITKQTNVKVKVLVKPKRPYNKNHSEKYVNLLKNLENQERLEILDSTSDVYSLISSVNLTLGIVFTSPVLIAKELNKPGAFVALSEENFPETYNDMKVISNVTELKKTIISTLDLNR